LIDRSFVAAQLTQEAPWCSSHGADNDFLGFGLVYYGLVYSLRAKIAVCGLNPHCGEGGEFGDEEPRIIEPAIAAARKRGFDAVGPLSGDTVFHQAIRGDFDAVVAMYHDQGLAPLKLAAFDNGVNWTLGLPFIRTSPDHGTAYDIAGRGIADPSSMIAAIRLAKQLVSGHRKKG